MNDLLDLPPIVMPAETKADLAPLDLRKIDLTDVALAQYGDWRKDVAATKANLATLVLDLSTTTKIKEARTLRQRLIGDPLATVRKVAAGIKSKMAATSKAVGAELEQIEAAYTEADALILPKIEAREAELEAERVEKARIERERVERLQAGVAKIRSYVQLAAGLPAERIAKGIAGLEAMVFAPESWQEYAAQATEARDESIAALRLMHAAAVQAEADRAERERLEAEAARLRAEAAERDRIEAARVEAERQARQLEEDARVAALAAQQEADLAAESVRVAAENGPVPDWTRIPPELLARATGGCATITTPDGTVADAATGEVIDPAPAQPAAQEQTQAAATPPAAPAADAPAVKLGDLSTRLGFAMTEAFVRDVLEIQPVPSKGRAVLIAEADMRELRDRLIGHIQRVLG